MNKKAIKTNKAPSPAARYSQALKIGNTLYLAGAIPLDPETNKITGEEIVAQTNRVFENIKAVLEADAMSFKNVIKVNAFLSDLKDFPEFNKIYNSIFTFDPPPVRTTIQAKLPLGALVEVEITAWKK
ncbi:MAG: Rid family detoxifying hydrolase [Elusimicrobia bacterium]|nr:Rid family detoxifying hydrolase [Elusimicrobiota bacterium]MBU2614966.1 Rid family detoxifying hydrolase [Elusimicrobiota bacterium]